MSTLVNGILTFGILAGRIRRLKWLAEIVNKDDLVDLQGILDGLEWSSGTDSTEVEPELLKNYRTVWRKPLAR